MQSPASKVEVDVQAAEAEQAAKDMISVYADFARNVAAMPVVVGRKSRRESFAGADSTYTIEAMMGDRRALQVLWCTLLRIPPSLSLSQLSNSMCVLIWRRVACFFKPECFQMFCSRPQHIRR